MSGYNLPPGCTQAAVDAAAPQDDTQQWQEEGEVLLSYDDPLWWMEHGSIEPLHLVVRDIERRPGGQVVLVCEVLD